MFQGITTPSSRFSLCILQDRYFAAHIAQGIDKTVPSWAYANPIPALASLGRHALPFYLLHQPIILGILELVYSVR